MGTSVLFHRMDDRYGVSAPPSNTDHCLYGPIIRRCLVLWDKHIGGILPWSVLFSSGDFLLLGILHLPQLLLDSYSRL